MSDAESDSSISFIENDDSPDCVAPESAHEVIVESTDRIEAVGSTCEECPSTPTSDASDCDPSCDAPLPSSPYLHSSEGATEAQLQLHPSENVDEVLQGGNSFKGELQVASAAPQAEHQSDGDNRRGEIISESHFSHQQHFTPTHSYLNDDDDCSAMITRLHRELEIRTSMSRELANNAESIVETSDDLPRSLSRGSSLTTRNVRHKPRSIGYAELHARSKKSALQPLQAAFEMQMKKFDTILERHSQRKKLSLQCADGAEAPRSPCVALIGSSKNSVVENSSSDAASWRQHNDVPTAKKHLPLPMTDDLLSIRRSVPLHWNGACATFRRVPPHSDGVSLVKPCLANGGLSQSFNNTDSASPAPQRSVDSSMQCAMMRQKAYLLERELLILETQKAILQDEVRILSTTRTTEEIALLRQRRY